MPEQNYYRVQRERERGDMQKRLGTALERDGNARAKDAQQLLHKSVALQIPTFTCLMARDYNISSGFRIIWLLVAREV